MECNSYKFSCFCYYVNVLKVYNKLHIIVIYFFICFYFLDIPNIKCYYLSFLKINICQFSRYLSTEEYRKLCLDIVASTERFHIESDETTQDKWRNEFHCHLKVYFIPCILRLLYYTIQKWNARLTHITASVGRTGLILVF